MNEGVIVGTSQGQEWLMPWWWMHYRLYNHHPVVFIDFGDLSQAALAWCQRRGEVIKLEESDAFMAKKDAIDRALASDWESMHPEVWEMRFRWYQKPLSLLRSPFKRTLWLDLDCQIRGSIQPLFQLPLCEGGIGLVPEHEASQQRNLQTARMQPGQTMYNAGVILYDQHSKIVQEWADRSHDRNHLFCSDQQLLVDVLFRKRLSFVSLSPLYNWTADRGANPNAVIVHWWGGAGKAVIKKQIDFFTHQLFIDLSFAERTSLVGENTPVTEFGPPH